MERPPIQNNSGSLDIVLPKMDYACQGEDRTLAVLLKRIMDMEEKIRAIETKKIIDETQFPKEVLEQNNILPPKARRSKRGRGYRPILKSEIEEAQQHSKFGSLQAEYLGVAESTLKKYSKMYNIWNPCTNVKGRRNMFNPEAGKRPLSEILEGKHPDVSDWTAKDKIIRGKVFPTRCAICGYDKRRIVDNKICLLLDHKDGDKTNFKKDNLQLLCLNCTFECGRGYIRSGRRTFDVDWLQGAQLDEIPEKSRY